MPKFMFVEPNFMVGWTAKYTDSVMLESTKIRADAYAISQINAFKNIWINNGEYEAFLSKSHQLVYIHPSYAKIIQKQIQLAQTFSRMGKRIYFIIPDKMYNAMATTELFYAYSSIIADKLDLNNNKNIKLVLVVQASSPKDAEIMLNRIGKPAKYYKATKISIFAVPKKVRELNNWNEIKNAILKNVPLKQIHYLGFTQNDVHDSVFNKIHSISTKYPIKKAINSALKDYNINVERDYFSIHPSILNASIRNSIEYEIKAFKNLFKGV
ncbi:MAG: hypothetical protein QXH07_06775 [Thermoplasmata archaeon]